jgi:hypothetical protein
MKEMTFAILMFSCMPNGIAQELELHYQLKADLNSDNVSEQISLISYDNNDFKLKINNEEFTGNIGDPVDGFVLIDINKWDAYKEIAVHTPGPSDDDIYLVVWYDGERIIQMGRLSRWPVFKGNGIVYVDGWEGFWTRRDKYQLDNARRELICVDQYAYYVGLTVEVSKGFRIYRDQEFKNEVALLSDGSEIEIVLCDNKGYQYLEYRYLIKSSSGLLGWTNYETLQKNATLPLAD